VQRLRLALSKGPKRVGVSPHLTTETDPVSETSCFSSHYLDLDDGQGLNSNSVILCVIHHCQNPIESTAYLILQLVTCQHSLHLWCPTIWVTDVHDKCK
jgi:hypothetical protein